MAKKHIIVISGKQFSGKDTVTDIILQHLPGFKRSPLADALKKEFGEEKNLSVKQIEMNKPVYRAELIELGNKRRSQDPDYWIKKVLSESDNIIVSDLRLQHELDIFKAHGAISIRVESSREKRAERGHLVKEDDATEIDLDNITNWDYIIENNSNLEQLKSKSAKVAKAIEKIICSKK